MKILKEMVFSLFPKFENNTTQIPECWPNSGTWQSSLSALTKSHDHYMNCILRYELLAHDCIVQCEFWSSDDRHDGKRCMRAHQLGIE